MRSPLRRTLSCTCSAFQKCSLPNSQLKHGDSAVTRSSLMWYWILVYLDSSIAGLLQLWSLDFDSLLYFCSTLLGLLSTVLVIVSPGAVFIITLRHLHSSAWHTRFQEFKNNRGLRSSLFYTVFLLRRLAFATALAFFSTCPKFQAVLFAPLPWLGWGTSATTLHTRSVLV